MNYLSIVRLLAALGLVQAVATAACALVALAFGEDLQVLAFSVTLVLLLVVCLSVLFLTPKPSRRATARDALAVFILWWGLASLAAFPPFMLGTREDVFIAALFEAVSALTTTGHSIIRIEEGAWPVSLLVWRGMLHFIGAWASLAACASIFAALNLGGSGIHRTVLFTIPEGSFFDAMPRVIWAALLAMTGLTLAVVSGLILAGIPAPRALADAVSVASTGLVLPGQAAMPPLSPLHAGLVFIGLLVSTIGLAVGLELRAGHWVRAVFDPEVIVLVMIGISLAAILVLAGLPLGPALAWIVSEQSTSGLTMFDPDIRNDIPLPILLLPALIGGAALSTAGGLKLARIAILTARAGEEFARLGFRGSVLSFKFRGRLQPGAVVMGVWVYLVAYLGAVGVFLLAFSLAGLGFESAASTSVGSLSNSGALVAISEEVGRSGQAGVAILAMLAGRLEVMALVPALTPSFWRD